MDNFIYVITSSILEFKVLDAVDILLITVIIYELIKLTRKTRAIQVLKGVGFFILFTAICELIGLTTISWLLKSFLDVGAVLIVVIFQPELRRAFEKMGTGRIIDISGFGDNIEDESIKDELHKAIIDLSMRKTGALIVFEKKTGLRDIMESGIEMDARIKSELVENIFFKNSPLHDGAMIIRKGRIAAAGCFLPMSDNRDIQSELGTRHRAALGISEVSDSYIIVVSEETGVISYAHEGMLTRYLDSKGLIKLLDEIFLNDRSPILEKIRKKGAK